MNTSNPPNVTKKAKTTLILLMALSFGVVVVFWAAIQLFKPQGLTLYFTQLALYLVLFGFALWGLKVEDITLQINGRRIVETLIFSLIGWLVFLLVVLLLKMSDLKEEFAVLATTPVWKTGLKILSTWFFVGVGEEVLFRGYFFPAFLSYFTRGTEKRRKIAAVLLSSGFFSLWHLPSRVMWLITGEGDLLLILISLVVLFLLGFGYAWLYLRSDNIVLTGLVHGLSDLPLVGMSTQLTPIILVSVIGLIEVKRLINIKKTR